jgi:ABC-type glycerol-3-phosphate transport system substrate-binding protein
MRNHWTAGGALLATAMLSAGASAQGSAPMNLTIMTSYGPNQSRGVVLQKLVGQFNTEHAGKITVALQVNPDHPAMQAKLRTMIAAGAPPDIFHYNFNPSDLAVPTSGALLDFSPYMDAEWRSHFSASDLARFTFDGKLVSIPFQQSPAKFYYNKALFQKAGIAQFPASWNELLQSCEALRKAGVACISLFTKDDAWHTSNALTYAAACFGGLDVFAGKSLDTPAVERAFSIVKQLFGYTTKDSVGANYDVSSKNFLLGKTAIIIDGPWAIGPMNNEFKNGEVAVGKAPSCDGAKAPDGYAVTDAPSPFAAGKQGGKAHADAVVEWFKYFTSDAAAALFAQNGSQPVAFRQIVNPQDINPLFASYLAASNEAAGKVISAQRLLHPAAQTALPSLFEALALDQITPEQAAQRLEAANN